MDDAKRVATEIAQILGTYPSVAATDLILSAVQNAVAAELERVCALIYAEGYSQPAPVAVARVCDEVLDRSGGLLGRVRDAARRITEG